MPASTRDAASGRQAAAIPKPDLFPFLAVLICTMGALIFLLIAFSVRVRPSLAVSEPVRVSPPADPLADLPRVPAVSASVFLPMPPREIVPPTQTQSEVDAPWLLRLQSLRQEKERREAIYANATAEEQSLRDRLAAANAKQQEQERLAAERTQANDRMRSDQDRRRAELMQTIASLEVDLKAKQAARVAAADELDRAAEAKAQAKTNSYRFLAIDRETGTRRHPIVIECRRDRWRFGSEGVEIGSDLAGYSAESNPLLAGILGTARHYRRTGETPYVLLVVPPEGIPGYEIAAAILRTAGVPYGYELVPDDLNLDWPAARPDAIAATEAAVRANETALSRRGRALPGPTKDGGFPYLNAKEVLREYRTARGRSVWDRGAALAGSVDGPSAALPPGGVRPSLSRRGTRPPQMADTRTDVPRAAGSRSTSASGRKGGDTAIVPRPTLGERNPTPQSGQSVAAGGSSPGAMSDGRLHWQKETVTPPASNREAVRLPQSMLTEARLWGRTANRFFGYEKRIPLAIVGDTLRSGDLELTDVADLDSRQLRRLLVELCNEWARKWGEPQRMYYWRPTLDVQASPSDPLVRRLQPLAAELEIGFVIRPTIGSPQRLRQATASPWRPSR